MLLLAPDYGLINNFLMGLPFAEYLPLPGVLIGLALLWFFLSMGNLLVPLYGTMGGLIVAMIIQRMPLGTQMSRAGSMQISQELEHAAATGGASWWTTMGRIVLPLLAPTLLAVGLASFTMAAREVSSVMFLAAGDTRPRALLITDYNFAAERGMASVANMILIILVLGMAFVQRSHTMAGPLAGCQRVADINPLNALRYPASQFVGYGAYFFRHLTGFDDTVG